MSEPKFRIFISEGDVFIEWLGEGPSIALNLGPEEEVFRIWADKMGERDFEE